jgi:hypothetical protein
LELAGRSSSVSPVDQLVSISRAGGASIFMDRPVN